MKRTSRHAACIVVALAALTPEIARSESSLNCSGGIVQLGETRLDLLAKCGKPALREQVTTGRSVVEIIDGEASETGGSAAERWTYNFGPSQFLYVVTLDGGKIVAIERGGYGYAPERLRNRGAGPPRCESAAIRVGDKKLDVLAKCGAPTAREFRQELRPTGPPAEAPTGSAAASTALVDVEEWTYDFGPQQFRAIVMLENGTVVRVERGNYGTPR